MRDAWDALGPLQLEVAERSALPVDIPVLCGIHDAGASFARYLAAGLGDFTLISTGTWLTTYQPSLPLDRLDPLRDTAACSDLLGRPVACARFMGGAEHAAIAGTEIPLAAPDVANIEALIGAGTMALPSFTGGGGPFPGTGSKGRIIGPAPETARARAALASLYVALMTAVALDLLCSRAEIVIDGALVDDPLFAGLIAALRPDQPVAVSKERAGVAVGAALLWGWSERAAPVRLDLAPVVGLRVRGLAAYTRRWRAAAEETAARPS